MEDATKFFQQLLLNSTNPYISTLAKENIQRLQQRSNPPAIQLHTERVQVEIPLIRLPSNSLVVPALIGNRVMGTFLIDTGANYTIITPRMARKLGVKITPETPRMALLTLQGYRRAPLVTVENFAIGGLCIPETQALVMDLGQDVLLAGLLGMNFFNQMEMTILADKLILSVDPATTPVRLRQ